MNMLYNNAILMVYKREGDATWNFQKKLKELDKDVF